MKKFFFRTFLAFALIFVFLFSITMLLEYKNKKALQSKVKVEVKVEDGVIQVPEEPAKVSANYEFSRIYFFSGLVISMVIPLLFYFYDGIGLIKKWDFRFKIVEGGVLFILYTVFSSFLLFPKVFFSAFYRAKLVGLNHQGFFDFIKEYLLNDSLDLLLSLPIAVIIYLFYIKKKSWYVIAGIILITVTLVSSYVYPYFDEMQNKVVDMEDGELKSKLLKLSEEAGIKGLDVKVIPKSEKTSSMNAYMTGINDSRRIVFWDTTLKGLNEKEILSVSAHEMGHYKLAHIQKSIFLSCLITIMSLLLLHNLMIRYKGKDYRKIDNIPHILFVLNVMGLLITPMETAYSRKIEVEADKFAMEITGDAYTNGALEIKFIESNLTPVDVDYLYKWLAYDHPTVRERIEISNEYAKKRK